jgi:endonuclease/exonuclease/phosphatase family metal-dependent hydrolase
MFRVLQFNMQFGQGWALKKPHYGKINLDDTIAEIRRHDADIVLLQEVEHAQQGGIQLNPPPNYTRLLASLGLTHGWFAYPRSDARELPFGVGLAILSRTPLHDTMQRDLPSPPINFQFKGKKTTPTDRLLIGAKTAIDGREIQLFNTHLLAFFMLGTTSAEHPQQREIVAQQLAGSKGPTILAGDFNVRKHADLIAQFASVGFRTAQDQSPTWRRKPYVFDHIFYNNPFRLVSQQVVPTLASDHHVLVADFEFA